MKKQELSLFLLIFAVFLCFCTGLFLGRNLNTVTPAPRFPQMQSHSLPVPVDLNLADQDQLASLPGIGPTLAKRILSYRDTHGSFTSMTELLNIDGIGEQRLDALLPYITAGG